MEDGTDTAAHEEDLYGVLRDPLCTITMWQASIFYCGNYDHCHSHKIS